MFNGAPGIVPIVGLLTLANYKMFGNINLTNWLASNAFCHFLAYPFLTA
jgi:hypothetical protein